MQDIAAAGQVTAVGQGCPAQVHAAFRPAARWSLGTTEATALVSLPASRLPSGLAGERKLCTFLTQFDPRHDMCKNDVLCLILSPS